MSTDSWIGRYITAAFFATASIGAVGDEQRPSPSEAAASGIELRTKVSPSVKYAIDNRLSEIRPENQPIPQISIPLRRNARSGKTAPSDRMPMDDGVARCLAMKYRDERRECLIRRSE